MLRLRAQVYQRIRTFFSEREILEVETPLLSLYGVTDVYLNNIPAICDFTQKPHTRFLQTSPEYAMKRLLAHGSGSIFQLCKAFRPDEKGRWHNPEFTMLEWYRVGFNHHQLMDEMDDFLQCILACKPAERYTYQTVFEKYLDLNPHTSRIENLLAVCNQHGISLSTEAANSDYDALLSILMTHIIEPQLGTHAPCFIYDYPANQASLAKKSTIAPFCAERFEVYIQGIELANGFHELTDPAEQQQRLESDQAYRQQHHLPHTPIDHRLLAALQNGLPPCAGVALGVDRLLMLLSKSADIQEVLSFNWSTA